MCASALALEVSLSSQKRRIMSGGKWSVQSRHTRHVASRHLTLAVLAMFVLVTAKGQVPLNVYKNFEGAQARPVSITADGTRLFAVNTGGASLSVFDLTQPSSPQLLVEIPVGIEPVSVAPRTDDEAWVVNQESDSISVVSVAKGIVTDTIYVPDEPADVVFVGTRAFVSVARSNKVCSISTTTHQVGQCVAVFGDYPRALAASADGSKVYAAITFAGNRTTIIPTGLTPPQPPPTNPALPAPPHVSSIVSIFSPAYAPFLQFTMPGNGVAVIDTSSLTVSSYYSDVGAINLGIAVRPTTGDLFVANTGALNLVTFEPNLRGHFVDNRITRIQVSSGKVTPLDLNPNINYKILPNPVALASALAQPTAVVFDPGGAFMWVAAFGTDRVAKVDTNGKVLSFIEIGPSTGSTVNPETKRGPRGLALDSAAQRLYVLNRISNTISVVNSSNSTVVTEIAVGSFDPTPTVIQKGRGYLYDAKLSGNGTAACAACHIDADTDHLAWNIGDPGGNMTTVVSGPNTFQLHPMKGPMTTQTVRGLANLQPYHWRGDQPNFAAFNPAFDGLMGGSQISSTDMTDFTNYINTINFQPNPNQNLDRSLPTSFNGGNASSGQTIYSTIPTNGQGLTCANCHGPFPGSGTNQLIVKLGNETQPMKNSELRNLYQKVNFNDAAGAESMDGFGFTHDGSVSSLLEFISGSFPGLAQNKSATSDIIALMLCFDTGTAPAVGYSRTATATNIQTTPVQSDLTLLSGQAAAGNIDLIAKGTINGVVHGLLYNPTANNYQTDQTGLGPFTLRQLAGFITNGDTLTFMGVPPGSGTWMGIDRNLNGILDYNEHHR
jgi:YVTN family beta-propeller protein